MQNGFDVISGITSAFETAYKTSTVPCFKNSAWKTESGRLEQSILKIAKQQIVQATLTYKLLDKPELFKAQLVKLEKAITKFPAVGKSDENILKFVQELENLCDSETNDPSHTESLKKLELIDPQFTSQLLNSYVKWKTTYQHSKLEGAISEFQQIDLSLGKISGAELTERISSLITQIPSFPLNSEADRSALATLLSHLSAELPVDEVKSEAERDQLNTLRKVLNSTANVLWSASIPFTIHDFRNPDRYDDLQSLSQATRDFLTSNPAHGHKLLRALGNASDNQFLEVIGNSLFQVDLGVEPIPEKAVIEVAKASPLLTNVICGPMSDPSPTLNLSMLSPKLALNLLDKRKEPIHDLKINWKTAKLWTDKGKVEEHNKRKFGIFSNIRSKYLRDPLFTRTKAVDDEKPQPEDKRFRHKANEVLCLDVTEEIAGKPVSITPRELNNFFSLFKNCKALSLPPSTVNGDPVQLSGFISPQDIQGNIDYKEISAPRMSKDDRISLAWTQALIKGGYLERLRNELTPPQYKQFISSNLDPQNIGNQFILLSEAQNDPSKEYYPIRPDLVLLSDEALHLAIVGGYFPNLQIENKDINLNRQPLLTGELLIDFLRNTGSDGRSRYQTITNITLQSCPGIGDDCVETILSAESTFRHVDLSRNPQISDRAFANLPPGCMDRLRTLNLKGTRVSRNQVEALHRQYPHLDIRWDEIYSTDWSLYQDRDQSGDASITLGSNRYNLHHFVIPKELLEDVSQDRHLELPGDISEEAAKNIIRYFYTGSLGHSDLKTKLEIVKYAQNNGLFDLYQNCGNQIRLLLAPKNCTEVWEYADKNDLQELKDVARRFITITCTPGGVGFYEDLSPKQKEVAEGIHKSQEEYDTSIYKLAPGFLEKYEEDGEHYISVSKKTDGSAQQIENQAPQVLTTLANNYLKRHPELSSEENKIPLTFTVSKRNKARLKSIIEKKIPPDTVLSIEGKGNSLTLEIPLLSLVKQCPAITSNAASAGHQGSLPIFRIESPHPKALKAVIESIIGDTDPIDNSLHNLHDIVDIIDEAEKLGVRRQILSDARIYNHVFRALHEPQNDDIQGALRLLEWAHEHNEPHLAFDVLSSLLTPITEGLKSTQENWKERLLRLATFAPANTEKYQSFLNALPPVTRAYYQQVLNDENVQYFWNFFYEERQKLNGTSEDLFSKWSSSRYFNGWASERS